MTTIKDTFARWWFAASAAALVVLYLLFQRRGQTIETLKADAQRALLAQKLMEIREQGRKSEEEYEKAKQRYIKLRELHAATFTKLGITKDSVYTGEGSGFNH